MARATVDDGVQESDLLLLRQPVRRYLARSVTDEQELDDLVQETLLRVWEVRGRVERAAAGSYAVATARNLVQSRDRSRQVHARHAHRLHEPPTVDGPEVHALQQEERLAAAQVAQTLTPGDLDLLAVPSRTAQERSAGRRSRLARARARARVDYLLHLRRLTLPTSRCRPVLEALSAGDRRQQDRVGAAQHLLTCQVCAACAPALVARERRLFGLVAPLLVLLYVLRRAVRRAPRTSTAVATGAAVAVAAVLVTSGGPAGAPPVPQAAAPAASASAPAPAAAPVPPLLVGSVPAADLLAEPGRQVVARDAVVLSVVSDEGLWVGSGAGTQVFVLLTRTGAESGQTVRAGDRVSFSATVRPLGAEATTGVDVAEGLGQLTAEGAYLAAPAEGLSIAP